MGKRSSAAAADNWPLRPGDLPHPKLLAKTPRLKRLEQNSAFRMLVYHQHRDKRTRSLMIFGYLLGWFVFFTAFFYLGIGMTAQNAIAYGLAIVIMLLVLLSVIFLNAGIEGYESIRKLMPYFRELSYTTLPSRDIALGIWGKTISRYPVGLIRATLVLSIFVILAILAILLQMQLQFFIHWMLLGSLAGIMMLLGELPALAWVPLPGSLLWIGGVRRSYARKVAGDFKSLPRAVFAVLGMYLLLVLCVVVVFLPLLVFIWVGLQINLAWAVLPSEAQTTTLAVYAVAAALVGWLCGWGWGHWIRYQGDRNLDRLIITLEDLIELRKILMFDE